MEKKPYKRDFKQLEERRRKAMRMLARGVAPADVAREFGVSRQTASTWATQLVVDAEAWRRRPLGRPCGLRGIQRAKLTELVRAGAVASDFATEPWTLARVTKLIKREFGLSYSTVHVWRLLQEMGFSRPPRRRAIHGPE